MQGHALRHTGEHLGQRQLHFRFKILALHGKATNIAGSPSPFDRILATRFGVAAVDLIAAGGFGMMVALHGDSIVSVDLAHATGHLKSVDPIGELVRAARAIGIGFGD